jgi:hypothetical protein
VDNNVDFFMKCLYYGVVYDLDELYDKVFEGVIPFTLKRYKKSAYYEKLPDQNKVELLESRLSKIEGKGRIYNNETYQGASCFKCSADYFE